MRAMILAAGRGERMRPRTDTTPKPLLPVAGRPMIEYTIEALAKAGFVDLVINIAHLGEQIRHHLGDGDHFGVRIEYSDEKERALETAGGIKQALGLLGDDPFLVVNGDIATDFQFSRLLDRSVDLAHLVLIANPSHHPEGDFALNGERLTLTDQPRYTFSGIGLYRAELFAHCAPGPNRLAPLLRTAIGEARVSGELHPGFWLDIGTQQRLEELEQRMNNRGFL